MSPVADVIAAFMFGTLVGILVQRSRFCNVAALRDAMLFRSYRSTKALLVGMMIMTFLFTLGETFGIGHPVQFDSGLNTVIGLFLFGIGMVMAGACTVGTWVRVGEGNIGALWALIFTFVGMFAFSMLYSVIHWPPAYGLMDHKVHLRSLQFGFANARTLQDETGIPAVVFGLIQVGVLALFYRAILRREARQKAAATGGSAPVGEEGGCH
ncbi:putative inner membrane protein [bacterium BMS3Bbin12]|nr:putative inner membrane protein [bacterium BMS3Abin12]GBE46990.1 putative inner membrane protein [bacterium BMS3Bbin12]GBE49495.1 putative inner membrane protein [bacterium BMS3Bbin13]HDJ86554.1 hypothetical protein [Chromatiales bacterium]HDK03772.1 hypothetical protein [Gammaproteobacteria bacterium]